VPNPNQTYLPTAELVLYEARGEWRFALSVYDTNYRSITAEGVLGDDKRTAIRKVGVLAGRLGLSRVGKSHIWRRLVPTEEF
jgi:hypothetical protein